MTSAPPSKVYTVLIKSTAEKFLRGLSKSQPIDFEKVNETISSLMVVPLPNGVQKLKGSESYRIKVGVYRVVYSVDHKIVTVEVLSVAHRKDIYRKK